MRFKRAQKYGFCAGVRLADRKVKHFVQLGGRDGRLLGQVVHNERVVDEMTALGVPTVESLDEIEAGSVVFSAHGVPPSFHDVAESKGLRVLDTTCPFVYDVHEEADRAVAEGAHLVFIGKASHREVLGYTHDRPSSSYDVVLTIEDASKVDWSKHAWVKVLYQTTLNAEEYEDVVLYIEKQVPRLSRADTICYATKENQDAVVELGNDPEVDLILVIGGRKSANTRHLWEIGSEYKTCFLVHALDDVRAEWFQGVETVGITAGASTPDYMIDEVEGYVRTLVSEPEPEPV